MRRFKLTFTDGSAFEFSADGYDNYDGFLHFFSRKEYTYVRYDYPGWFARTFLGKPERIAREEEAKSYTHVIFYSVNRHEVRTIEVEPVT